MKKTKIIFIILNLLIFSTSKITYANYTAPSPDSIGPKNTNLGIIENIGSNILGVVSIIGTALSVICLAIIGIKYMLGAPEEKSQYKNVLMPYLIGAIIVFGASSILGILHNIVEGI